MTFEEKQKLSGDLSFEFTLIFYEIKKEKMLYQFMGSCLINQLLNTLL